jgi:hypothetical protein
MDFAFKLHGLATGVMLGVIWIVQLLTYPGLRRIPESQFAEAHAAHTSRITFVVAPAMALEALSALGLWMRDPGPFWTLQGLLILANATLTFRFARGPHARLVHEKSDAEITRLIRANLSRCLIWSVRAVSLLLWSPSS